MTNNMPGVSVQSEKLASPLRVTGRASKSGEAKAGQKLAFDGRMGQGGSLKELPADLNKISAIVPPGAKVIVTMRLNRDHPPQKITFENADPVNTMTGRIYFDQKTGEISVVRDNQQQKKAEGPAQNQFQTRRILQTLRPNESNFVQKNPDFPEFKQPESSLASSSHEGSRLNAKFQEQVQTQRNQEQLRRQDVEKWKQRSEVEAKQLADQKVKQEEKMLAKQRAEQIAQQQARSAARPAATSAADSNCVTADKKPEFA